MGGIYPVDSEDAVTAALKPREENARRPALLDVGSGSGIWYVFDDLTCLKQVKLTVKFRLAQMAKKFPDVDCVGIDFKPKKPL